MSACFWIRKRFSNSFTDFFRSPCQFFIADIFQYAHLSPSSLLRASFARHICF